MAVNPLMQIAAAGIQHGLKGMKAAAQEVAELNGGAGMQAGALAPPADPTDGLDALLDLIRHKRQVQVSARAVAAADEAIGFLLDIRV